MRWTRKGKMESDGISIFYSGSVNHQRGVGILLNQLTLKSVTSREPVSDRIITVRLQARFSKVTLIQVYAPTNTTSDTDKDEFYEQLQNVVDATT